MASRGHHAVLDYHYGLFLELLEATVAEETEGLRKLAVAVRVAVWGEEKDFKHFMGK